jgi:hypothetical protein
MKKYHLTTLFSFVILLYSSSLFSQTNNSGLNQVELMKQWIGTWRTEGTKITSELKAFGMNGLEGYQRIEAKDSVVSEYRFIYGYDKPSDKYVSASISKNNQGILLMAFWFISKTQCERVPIDFVNNPEMAASKAIYEFKTPNLIKATFSEKNKPDRVFNIIREKK